MSWGPSPREYSERVLDEVADAAPPSTSALELDGRAALETFGITWEPFDVEAILPSGLDRARARCLGALPELIWDAASLEGNTYTLPEVRTLLDGVTVGGKPVSDTEQILALRDAYTHLDNLVADGKFSLSKGVSDALHAQLARHEVIESGHFRGEGTVRGGGHVRLRDGSRAEGVAAGDGGRDLVARSDRIVGALEGVGDPREAALVYFAAATRSQFYVDGNKRTARLMACGHLMASGYDAISIAASRQGELHHALDAMFTTDDATALLQLLASSTLG